MGARRVKITQRAAEAAEPNKKRYLIHDSELPGFRVHVRPNGSKSFYVYYRVAGGRAAKQREAKIGDWPTIKADQARRIASDWILKARGGADPAADRNTIRTAPRMDILFDKYLSEHARPHKKPTSLKEDERLIERTLRPALGSNKVAEVKRSEISALHQAMSNTPYLANRALALLSKAFSLAELWEMRPQHSNPCQSIRRYNERQRRRYLSAAELSHLGAVIRQAEADGFVTLPAVPGKREAAKQAGISAHSLAAIRLLVFVGARKSEILSLRWDWIDWDNRRLNLPDSKTGERSIPLNPVALEVLNRVPRVEDNPHVIVGGRKGQHLVNPYKGCWIPIRELAGIPDVRLHDLRHSFASVGAGGGLSLPIIGALLGHTKMETTQRYAHLADDPLKLASDLIGARIKAAMGDCSDSDQVPYASRSGGR